MNDAKAIAIRHLDMSNNFLHLVGAVLSETVKQGNTNFYFGPARTDIEEHFSEITYWSDFNIIVPTLFNFFHAIELKLKGAIYLAGGTLKKPNHSLSELLNKFEEYYPNKKILINIFRNYINPSSNCQILQKFYSVNGFEDSSMFYDILKYPYTRNFQKSYNYKDIRYLGEEGITFFKQIISDIETVKKVPM